MPCVKATLSHWEDAVRHYRELVRGQMSIHSDEVKTAAIQKTKDARKTFHQTYENWNRLIQAHPTELSELLLSSRAA